MTTTNLASANERRYHNTDAAYSLPNEASKPEHDRLETQADQLAKLMNNQIIHAPLAAPSIHKVLDMGCGTGIVTHTIASKFPNAQVYGLDLSPVPNIRAKLPNIEYIQGDFNKLANSDARFAPESFDYIFSRLLIGGMTDWKGYVERCVALTKPGGWVEMHDLDLSFHRVPDPITPSQRASLMPHSLTLAEVQSKSHPGDACLAPCSWLMTMAKLSAANGLDARCGQQLPRLFTEAALEDVRIKRYMYPFALWDGLTDIEKTFVLYHNKGMGKHFPHLIRKLGQGQNTVAQEEIEEACEGARRENEGSESSRGFVWIYVVCGRKAMK